MVADPKGHMGVVVRLLGCSAVNPNIVDFYGESALFCAAWIYDDCEPTYGGQRKKQPDHLPGAETDGE